MSDSPFELSRSEPGTQGVRRVLRLRVAKALDSLRGSRLSDQKVHAARKELKKARAALRLLRHALGDSSYDRANAVLRDAARPLSEVRDGKALINALDRLVEHFGAPARALRVDGLKRAMRRRRTDARRRILKRPAGLSSQRAALQECCERATRWRIGRHGWSVIGPGLKRTYAMGRNALATAQSERTMENLHEWRKQTKYLWHQLQVMQPLWPGLIGELADQAHKLSDYLGDDHDLAMLREEVLELEKALPSVAARNALVALIDRSRNQLQDKAVLLGRRIYEEKPKAFAARFGKYWREWQSQSVTLQSRP